MEGKNNKVLVLQVMDLEKEFNRSMNEYNNGFILDDSIDYYRDLYNNKSADEGLKMLTKKNSLFSYKYGISISDDEEILPRMYSCDCERTIGMDNVGEICPYCETKVKRTKEKTLGWFRLKYDKVFHPLLASLLFTEGLNMNDGKGKQPFYTLLNKNLLEYSWNDIIYQEIDGQYSGKLFEFVNRYLKKYKGFFEIYNKPEYWYTNSIPVISKNFRFISVEKSNFDTIDNVDQHDLTADYINISYLCNELNREHESLSMMKSKKLNKIKEITKSLSNIFSIIRKEFLDGKKAFLAQEQYSRRIGSSGRLTLLPMVDESKYGIDSCILSEDYFRATFRKSIVKVCKKLKLTPITIKRITNQNTTLTEEERSILYNDIFPLVKHKFVYMNREPAIYMTSLLMLKVVALTKDYCIRAPFFILPAIAKKKNKISKHHWRCKMWLTAGKMQNV